MVRGLMTHRLLRLEIYKEIRVKWAQNTGSDADNRQNSDLKCICHSFGNVSTRCYGSGSRCFQFSASNCQASSIYFSCCTWHFPAIFCSALSYPMYGTLGFPGPLCTFLMLLSGSFTLSSSSSHSPPMFVFRVDAGLTFGPLDSFVHSYLHLRLPGTLHVCNGTRSLFLSFPIQHRYSS